MNNEPVAWGMTWKDGEIYDVISPAQHAKEEGDYTIPLYTHSVNVTYELTMEKCRQQQAKTMELYYIVMPVVETTSVDYVAGPFASWNEAHSKKRAYEHPYALEVMQTTAVMY